MGSYDINSLKELFNEIFYDWGFTKGPQITQDGEGYSINKTYIGKDDKKEGYYVVYKTSEYSLSPKVYKEFSNFYKIYKQNSEMDFILDKIENYWHNNKIKQEDDSLVLGRMSLNQKNKKFYLTTEHIEKELDRDTFIQVWNLILSIK